MMSPERRRRSLVAFFLGPTAASISPDSSDLIPIVSRRAYRDLSRTIHGMGSHPNVSELRSAVDESLTTFVRNLKDISTREDFDAAHKQWCENAIRLFQQYPHPDREWAFSHGQAQKWLNMALKYLAVVGHTPINHVYEFLHVPLDRIIYQQGTRIGVPYPKTAWSRLTVDQYVSYQRDLKDKIEAKFGTSYAVLDWEADEWIGRE